MDKDDLKDLLEIITEAEEFRPIVKSVIDVIKSFGPELKQIPDALLDYMVDKRIAAIERFEKAGFTRRDAIDLTMDCLSKIERSSRQINSNTKK